MATTWVNPIDFNKSLNQGLVEGSYSGSPIPLIMGGTGSAASSALVAFDALQPMTAIGQLLYGGASGVATVLAVGTSGQVLQSNGSAAPTWVTNTVSPNYATTVLNTYTIVDQLTYAIPTAAATYTLPTGTLVVGTVYKVVNNSGGAFNITCQASTGPTTVGVPIAPGTSLSFIAIATTGTAAASYAIAN